MFCFAPASVESIPDRWNLVNQLIGNLTCMSYHTLYPILVHKNLSALVGFEPTSDTSRPKEGSRSMSSTTGEGRWKRLQNPFFKTKNTINESKFLGELGRTR